MATISIRYLEKLADTALPLMDDQGTFDGPAPVCVADAHEWAVVHDKKIEWRDAYANGFSIYPVAIVCAHCDFAVGFC